MHPNHQNSIASLKGVTKQFDGNRAVSNVSFDVYHGEVISILGPNGAGKTTLINMMLGKLSLSSGSIKIFDLEPGSIQLKRQCGIMLQVAGLPDMSKVKEHIQLFQSYYANPMDYHKVINIAGLKNEENKYSKDLSSGQKQRLLFALSICGNPKLLFLDEPSVGMDISARKSLWQAITDLKAQGTSVVLTTHYLEEADQLSDRIIMLSKGKIIQTGSPQQLKAKINVKKIRFSCSSELDTLKNILKTDSIKRYGEHIEIQTKNAITTLKKIFDSNTKISNLTVTGSALEDAFIFINAKANESQNSMTASTDSFY